MSLVDIEDLDVKYGDLQVLWELSLSVSESDSVVAIVGPNGAGKTTLLKALSGLLEPASGTVELFDKDISTLTPPEIVEEGFVHVSEERNLFGEMSVYKNLKMGAYTHTQNFTKRLEEIYELFPVLEERRSQQAQTLSGGEQQMLAIGRGLMANPDVLALDEPSGALAPRLIQRVFDKIETISNDTTVLLVEQHVNEALSLADHAYILENGRIATSGDGATLLESEEIEEAYLRG